ncbi:MAG: TIGR01777 family oxidoreductase [Aurantibacter sp.]
MKYLITGATGLVGSETVKLCHEKGIAVNYLTTNREKIVSQENYRGFLWNPELGEIDTDCFKGVSAIINLAGAPISKRWTSDYKKKVLSSRVNSLRTLYNALENLPGNEIDSLVSASAIGIYPNSLDHYYSEEDIGVDESFLGEVVELWERECDKFELLDFNVAKVRVGLVLSSKGGALPQMARPVRNFMGAAFGSGEQWQSWIHITDLARIFLFLVENNIQGTFNGVAPNPVTQNKLIREIARVWNRPLLLPNVPKFFIKTFLGEMSYLVLSSQRVSSKNLEEEGFVFDHPNISGALTSIYRQNGNQKSGRADLSQEFIS